MEGRLTPTPECVHLNTEHSWARSPEYTTAMGKIRRKRVDAIVCHDCGRAVTWVGGKFNPFFAPVEYVP